MAMRIVETPSSSSDTSASSSSTSTTTTTTTGDDKQQPHRKGPNRASNHAAGQQHSLLKRGEWSFVILAVLSATVLIGNSSSLMALHRRNWNGETAGAPERDILNWIPLLIQEENPEQRKIRDLERRIQELELGKCAINLYGLPRAFKSLVLPSVIKNIVRQNMGCDYFVHFYNVSAEAGGRSGSGGDIQPTEIYLLQEAIHNEVRNKLGTSALPTVTIVSDTQESFEAKRKDIWKAIRTVKDPTSTTVDKLLYVPFGFSLTSAENIIKMWHSIQSAWQAMEEHAALHNITYSRVGMMRSDVFFVSPIRVWTADNDELDEQNQYAVIPGFGKYPVSDRMIYGPYNAVKVWANQRFDLIDSHMKFVNQFDPGQGLHSERFVNHTILPVIKKTTDVTIVEHSSICFFRARADESLWITDCREVINNARLVVKRVEKILKRKCNRTILQVQQRPGMEGRTQVTCPKDFVHDEELNEFRYVAFDPTMD